MSRTLRTALFSLLVVLASTVLSFAAAEEFFQPPFRILPTLSVENVFKYDVFTITTRIDQSWPVFGGFGLTDDSAAPQEPVEEQPVAAGAPNIGFRAISIRNVDFSLGGWIDVEQCLLMQLTPEQIEVTCQVRALKAGVARLRIDYMSLNSGKWETHTQAFDIEVLARFNHHLHLEPSINMEQTHKHEYFEVRTDITYRLEEWKQDGYKLSLPEDNNFDLEDDSADLVMDTDSAPALAPLDMAFNLPNPNDMQALLALLNQYLTQLVPPSPHQHEYVRVRMDVYHMIDDEIKGSYPTQFTDFDDYGKVDLSHCRAISGFLRLSRPGSFRRHRQVRVSCIAQGERVGIERLHVDVTFPQCGREIQQPALAVPDPLFGPYNLAGSSADAGAAGSFPRLALSYPWYGECRNYTTYSYPLKFDVLPAWDIHEFEIHASIKSENSMFLGTTQQLTVTVHSELEQHNYRHPISNFMTHFTDKLKVVARVVLRNHRSDYCDTPLRDPHHQELEGRFDLSLCRFLVNEYDTKTTSMTFTCDVKGVHVGRVPLDVQVMVFDKDAYAYTDGQTNIRNRFTSVTAALTASILSDSTPAPSSDPSGAPNPITNRLANDEFADSCDLSLRKYFESHRKFHALRTYNKQHHEAVDFKSRRLEMTVNPHYNIEFMNVGSNVIKPEFFYRDGGVIVTFGVDHRLVRSTQYKIFEKNGDLSSFSVDELLAGLSQGGFGVIPAQIELHYDDQFQEKYDHSFGQIGRWKCLPNVLVALSADMATAFPGKYVPGIIPFVCVISGKKVGRTHLKASLVLGADMELDVPGKPTVAPTGDDVVQYLQGNFNAEEYVSKLDIDSLFAQSAQQDGSSAIASSSTSAPSWNSLTPRDGYRVPVDQVAHPEFSTKFSVDILPRWAVTFMDFGLNQNINWDDIHKNDEFELTLTVDYRIQGRQSPTTPPSSSTLPASLNEYLGNMASLLQPAWINEIDVPIDVVPNHYGDHGWVDLQKCRFVRPLQISHPSDSATRSLQMDCRVKAEQVGWMSLRAVTYVPRDIDQPTCEDRPSIGDNNQVDQFGRHCDINFNDVDFWLNYEPYSYNNPTQLHFYDEDNDNANRHIHIAYDNFDRSVFLEGYSFLIRVPYQVDYMQLSSAFTQDGRIYKHDKLTQSFTIRYRIVEKHGKVGSRLTNIAVPALKNVTGADRAALEAKIVTEYVDPSEMQLGSDADLAAELGVDVASLSFDQDKLEDNQKSQFLPALIALRHYPEEMGRFDLKDCKGLYTMLHVLPKSEQPRRYYERIVTCPIAADLAGRANLQALLKLDDDYGQHHHHRRGSNVVPAVASSDSGDVNVAEVDASFGRKPDCSYKPRYDYRHPIYRLLPPTENFFCFGGDDDHFGDGYIPRFPLDYFLDILPTLYLKQLSLNPSINANPVVYKRDTYTLTTTINYAFEDVTSGVYRQPVCRQYDDLKSSVASFFPGSSDCPYDNKPQPDVAAAAGKSLDTSDYTSNTYWGHNYYSFLPVIVSVWQKIDGKDEVNLQARCKFLPNTIRVAFAFSDAERFECQNDHFTATVECEFEGVNLGQGQLSLHLITASTPVLYRLVVGDRVIGGNSNIVLEENDITLGLAQAKSVVAAGDDSNTVIVKSLNAALQQQFSVGSESTNYDMQKFLYGLIRIHHFYRSYQFEVVKPYTLSVSLQSSAKTGKTIDITATLTNLPGHAVLWETKGEKPGVWIKGIDKAEILNTQCEQTVIVPTEGNQAIGTAVCKMRLMLPLENTYQFKAYAVIDGDEYESDPASIYVYGGPTPTLTQLINTDNMLVPIPNHAYVYRATVFELDLNGNISRPVNSDKSVSPGRRLLALDPLTTGTVKFVTSGVASNGKGGDCQALTVNVDGETECSITFTHEGANFVKVEFNTNKQNDIDYTASYNNLNLLVSPPSTVALDISPNPPVVNRQATLRAVISAQGQKLTGASNGYVQFTLSSPLDSPPVDLSHCAKQPVFDGVSTCDVTITSRTSFVVNAWFSGDAQAATSADLPSSAQGVTLDVNIPLPQPVTIHVTTDSNLGTVGDVIGFTAKLTMADNNTPVTATTGTLSFYFDDVLISTCSSLVMNTESYFHCDAELVNNLGSVLQLTAKFNLVTPDDSFESAVSTPLAILVRSVSAIELDPIPAENNNKVWIDKRLILTARVKAAVGGAYITEGTANAEFPSAANNTVTFFVNDRVLHPLCTDVVVVRGLAVCDLSPFSVALSDAVEQLGIETGSEVSFSVNFGGNFLFAPSHAVKPVLARLVAHTTTSIETSTTFTPTYTDFKLTATVREIRDQLSSPIVEVLINDNAVDTQSSAGTVAFYKAGNTLVSGCDKVPVVKGQAECVLHETSPNSAISYTAIFSGQTDVYESSTSQAVNVKVHRKANIRISISQTVHQVPPFVVRP